MKSVNCDGLIVISGISGRFSGASDINQLWDRLCKGEKLYGKDDTPYPKVLQGIPKSRGSVYDSNRFDHQFFGLTKEEADLLDGQVRLLYEVTYEAFLDAGILPSEWSSSRTGVFIGSFIDDTDLTPRSCPFIQSIPTRLSYQFNLKGPSIRVDTACASSLTALQLAKLSIESGECDQAIVAGLCLHQRSFINASFCDFGILSKRGLSAPLDSDADGYIRSEAIVAMIVQRKPSAKRIYAQIVGIKSNTDGYTQEGVTFPSRYAQKEAMIGALEDGKCKPTDIHYIEAHLTGTQAGDKTECLSILDAYRSQSSQPIYVGALKSNLGHTEAAAGLSSLTKAALILQNESIPPIVPPRTLNPEIEPLVTGKIIPVTEKRSFNDNLLAVNAFGFGGANVHIILKGNDKTNCSQLIAKERLVLMANRTKLGITKTFDLIECNPESRTNDFLSLLDHISRAEPGMIYRAYGILKNETITTKVTKQLTATRPLGLIVMSPLTETPRDLSSLPEFCYYLDCAKAWTGLSSTLATIEFFNLLNFNFDTVLSFDSALMQLAVKTKSFNQIIIDNERRSSKTNRLTARDVQLRLNNLLGRESDNFSGDEMIWSSQNFRNQKCESIDEIDFLIIDGSIQLISGNQISQLNSKSTIKSIWQIIGELYLLGQNIDLMKVHPKVDYPVHRKCPSISPLIQWDHSNEFNNNLYPDYFTSQNATTHQIDLFDPEYSNISDHIIDGKVIMPAAGFVYLIGKHLGRLCFDRPKQVGQFSFKLWEVKFIEACPLTEEVDIVTVHDPNTGKFVIKSNQAVYATGLATVTASNQTEGVEVNLRSDSAQDDDELKQADIYQIVRLRGYHFDRKYKSLTRSKATRSIAYVKYNDDWIALLDGLLQVDQFWEKSRLLKVPTSIKSLLFDCDRFQQALEGHKDSDGYQPLMISSPAHGYVNTFGFSLNGIGWTAIKRRDFDKPKIAISKFQSYFDDRITLNSQQLNEHREYHEMCLSALQKSKAETNTDDDPDKCLLRLLTKFKGHHEPFSTLLEQESQHLWNDIITKWPEKALNSVLNVVLSNTKRSEAVKIGYLHHLPKLHRDKISEAGQNQRKFCEFVNLERQSISTISDLDLIVFIDTSSRLFPQGKGETLVESLNRCASLDQHFVLVQYRTDLSTTEKEILSRLSVNSIEKRSKFDEMKNLDIEHLGYVKVAQSFVAQSCIKFELYRKKLDTNRLRVKQIYVSEGDYDWIDEVKLNLDKDFDRIWLISQSVTSGILGFFNCLYLEPKGKKFRCCYRNIEEKSPRIGPSELNELIEKDLVVNVQRNGLWGHVTLENVVESEQKIKSDHYYYTFEKAGMLETLNWTENYSKTICPKEKLIKVAYAAINFRDTLIASGVVPVEAYPKEDCFDLGLEFSGVTADGQRVMGMVLSKGFASYIPIDSVSFMFPIPNNWSLKDAATIPVCYMTAYYALVIRGALKPGETVLIHSGSGGVGLAAISIALNLGCKVFTTVSNREKRLAVISMFPQLDEHASFADSRSTSFEDHVLIQTQGRGVDIVLNSLTDDKLIAGIRCLSPGGKFIDLSKRDFIQDNPLDQFQLEDNKTFETVCLVYLLTSIEDNLRSKAAVRMLEKLFETGFETGQIVALPSQEYDKQSVEQAFRTMRKGQHIGKLLIKMNGIDESGHFRVEPLLVNRRTYFCPNKSYLIVGGLGGMGLELVRWMVVRGARKVVISSRSGLKTGYQRLSLKNTRDLTNNQATIVIVRFDLTNFRGSARAIREATRLGPIGGIFNLAAVLKDGLIENQTKETFQIACDPKIKITKNLDKISRSECPELDYFVCFSSIAVQGNMGQTNYAYANSFTETICESRRQDGLPGLAIEWGPIADVGLAARTFGDKQAISNYLNQSIDSFLKTLDTFLGLKDPVCYSAIPSVQKVTKASDAFTKVARIMGLKDIGSVDHNKTLRELGVDSVQSIEIQIYLSQEFKQTVKQFTIAELTLNDLKSISQTDSSSPSDVISNQIIKEKLLIPLNSNTESPIFFFPPAIADFLSMMPLASGLKCQVIGINYTDEVLAIEQFDRLTEVYYQEIMKSFSNLSQFLFVAYSFGVPIAFDLARKIQTRLGTERIEKMIFIDTSPVGQQHSYKFFRRLRESGNFNWDSMKDPRLSMDRKRNIANDRMKIINVLEGITGESGEKNTEVFFGFWDKMASIIDLTFDHKFIGKVIHYQANEQPSALLDSLNYDMEKAIDGPVDLRMIKSNHFEIINHGKEEILAGINECLQKELI